MRTSVIAWVAVIVPLLCATAAGFPSVLQFRFSSPGQFPGAFETTPASDSLTQIAGYYNIESGDFGYQNGYLQSTRSGSKTSFLSLQPPGGWFSFASGVNNHGVVVGGSCVPPQQCNDPQTTNGFSYLNGIYTTIDYPGAESTGAYGINDLGQIVGGYCLTVSVCGSTLGVTDHGFLDNNGTFSSLDYPGAQATQAYAINNVGTIVGTYEINNSAGHSFMYQNGQYTNIDFPGAFATYVRAINNKGIVAGAYELKSTLVLGFLYKAGEFYTVQYPNSNATGLAGINDKGIIVGAYNPPQGLSLPFKGVPVK